MRVCEIPFCTRTADCGVKDNKSDGTMCMPHTKDYLSLWFENEEDQKRLGSVTLTMLTEEHHKEGR